MSDLKTYLASKYMSGPKADAILARSTDPSVKKKRKKVRNEDYIGGSSNRGEGSTSVGLGIQDEDGWKGEEDIDFDAEDAPGEWPLVELDLCCLPYTYADDRFAVLGKDLATYKKAKSQWSTVGASTIPLAGPSGTTTDADGETKAEQEPTAPVQLTKRRGGLRTAAELREEEEARRAAEKSPTPPDDKPGEGGRPDPTRTIHRDASGRILDVEKLKEEERKKAEEEVRKAKEREEWTKGVTQRRERELRAREEIEMRSQDVSRWVRSLYDHVVPRRCLPSARQSLEKSLMDHCADALCRFADDYRMNKELKEVERWNDPAAEFITVSGPFHQPPFAPSSGDPTTCFCSQHLLLPVSLCSAADSTLTEKEEAQRSPPTQMPIRHDPQSLSHTSWVPMGRSGPE